MEQTTIISVDKWTVRYETALEERGLLEWAMSLDDETLGEARKAVEGEEKPSDVAGQVRWMKERTIVKNIIETALGECCQAVYDHPHFDKIRKDANCRILRRIEIIRGILIDLVSTTDQIGRCSSEC